MCKVRKSLSDARGTARARIRFIGVVPVCWKYITLTPISILSTIQVHIGIVWVRLTTDFHMLEKARGVM
jgi:hypothetical protein